MKVSKTASGNYDTEELEYCCPELKSLVIGDGGAIKLNQLGLVLRANPDHKPRRVKYCPECGKAVEHVDQVQEAPTEAPKPVQRDTDKDTAKPTSDFRTAIGK